MKKKHRAQGIKFIHMFMILLLFLSTFSSALPQQIAHADEVSDIISAGEIVDKEAEETTLDASEDGDLENDTGQLSEVEEDDSESKLDTDENGDEAEGIEDDADASADEDSEEALEDESTDVNEELDENEDEFRVTTFAENSEPQAITENIIDELKLFYEDDTEYQDGDFIEIGEDLRLEVDWSLPNGHGYKSGDTFEFQLPKQLQIHNTDSGTLGEYGTYEVTLDGKATFTFNERIENESNVHGEFWFETELEETEINSTNEHLEIIFNDDVAKKITINVKPTGGQAIHKEGQPVNGNFNTKEIQWTILVNTTRDELKNAIVNDPIFEGLELDVGSIVLTEIEVDIAGNEVKKLDKVTGFTNNSTKEALNIDLGDTNKAYKLIFTTKMKEEEKDNEGWKAYPNTVYLNSDGQTQKESGASVSVNRPKSIEKTSSNFNEGDRSIEWTVNANFNEKNLKTDDVIKDEFTFTIGDENFNDIFEIIEEDITIEQVDEFNNDGSVKEKSDAKDLFNIKVEGNKVTYKLKEDTNKAFILTYKTQAKDGKYITDDGKIVNKVDLNGKTTESGQGVIQQVGKKTNAGIDYENKTIDWTITINSDKQDLRNFVLTDDFAGSGQKLVKDSIKISPEKQDATIDLNPADIPEGEGFEIDFGDITDTYTITYQTEFTYDFEGEKTPNFKNGVDITYTTSDEGPEYELEIGDEVPPNKETKSNGAKNGTANNETKEITWTVDINYNQLELSDAKLIDEIAENQSLVDGSVKIYPTTIDKDGNITPGEATDNFAVNTDNNVINVDFGEIDQSYRIEFVTIDKDEVYNSNEVYENTAHFIPREGEEHNLKANVTLPNQGEFLGKKGLHNKEDWTIDWEVDVNKSKSKLTDVKVKDDLGSTDAQILLEDSIKVTKEGSDEKLVEGEDYNLTVNGNELVVHFPGEITDYYIVTYSSYIVAEDDAEIKNEAEIQSVDEVIVGKTEKTETVQVKISTGGGTGQGETGGLIIEKVETGTNRPLEDVSFELVKEVGNQEIVVREGTTDADGKLEWKGLKFGDYTLNEVIPEGYLGEEEQTVTISSDDSEGVKTLTIENERQTGIAKIVKVDAVTSDQLDGAEFKITNQTTNQMYTFTTKDGGEISEDVPFGEYTVEEVAAPNGYRVTEDIDNITVEIDKTTEITVTNEAIVEVAGEKTWIADADQELPESIIVELLADGFKVDEKEVTAVNDWNYSFTDLDKYDAEGNEIEYSIDEVELDGYVSEKDGFDLTNIQTIGISGEKTWNEVDDRYRPDSITIQLLANGKNEAIIEVSAETDWTYEFTDLAKYDKLDEEIEYTVKEVDIPTGYKSEVDGFDITNTQKVTKVSGEKKWDEVNSQYRPDSVTVQLLVNGEAESTVEVSKETEWTYEFTDLAKYDKAGKEITYTVEELDIPAGYDSKVDGYDITNKQESIEITGEKIWKEVDPAYRPDSITVQLLADGEEESTVEVTEETNWNYSFTDLAKYDKTGEEIKYAVEEVDGPADYNVKVDGYNITNTQKTYAIGDYTWIDRNKDGIQDENEEVLEGVKVELFDKDGNKLAETETDEDGLYIFDELPAGDYKVKFTLTDEQAKEYKFTQQNAGDDTTVDSDADPDTGWTKEFRLDDSNDYLTTDYTDQDFKATEGIDPTWDAGVIELVHISGTKTWLDDDSIDRPEEITVYLLANDGETDKTVTVEANTDWQYAFNNLDKYDIQGEEITYTVNEKAVEGYETQVNDFDITNLRVGETEVAITKSWNDDNETDRPDVIKVNLLQNGDFYKEYEVTAENDWKLMISELPAYDDQGKAYEYSVTEHDVLGYASEIDGFDITNTRTETKDIEITKSWLDDDTKDRPEAIEVELYRFVENGKREFVEVYELTSTNDWKLEIKDLPSFNADGKAYTYEIEEIGVDGYETQVNGFDITNLRIGTTSVEGTKTWKDTDADNRPLSITVDLLQNGKKIDEIKVTDATNWTYSFTNLEAFDENGVAYEYTVAEPNVPEGYTVTIEGFDITNTSDNYQLSDEGGKKDTDGTQSKEDGDELPKTATNIFNLTLVGFGLIAIGLFLFLVRRKRIE